MLHRLLSILLNKSHLCISAFNVVRWEQLQQEKEDLERRFEEDLQGLRTQQQRELGALEERLKAEHLDETEKLQAQQRAELGELQFRQQEQVCEHICRFLGCNMSSKNPTG